MTIIVYIYIINSINTKLKIIKLLFNISCSRKNNKNRRKKKEREIFHLKLYCKLYCK